jgi:peptide/nickel transport system permease protein
LLLYSLRRIALFVPTFLIVSFAAFAIIHLAPGDPVEMFMSGGLAAGQSGISTQKLADQQRDKEALRHELGLDRPIPVQYAFWLERLASADFGRSMKDHQPVWDKIRERLPVTVGIELLVVLFGYLVAVPLGIYSAVRPGSRLDQISTVTIFMLYSLPSFWIGVLLIVFFGGGDYFAWFPPGGLRSIDASSDWSFLRRATDLGHHLALPLFVSTLGSYTELSRFLRSSLLENMRQDFVRTARAKGVPERNVILVHVLRNSLISTVTILAGILPGLISGSVLIENVFSVPGLGQLAYQAVLARDYPVILALFTTGTALTLVGILLADLGLALVDPRIQFAGASE